MLPYRTASRPHQWQHLFLELWGATYISIRIICVTSLVGFGLTSCVPFLDLELRPTRRTVFLFRRCAACTWRRWRGLDASRSTPIAPSLASARCSPTFGRRSASNLSQSPFIWWTPPAPLFPAPHFLSAALPFSSAAARLFWDAAPPPRLNPLPRSSLPLDLLPPPPSGTPPHSNGCPPPPTQAPSPTTRSASHLWRFDTRAAIWTTKSPQASISATPSPTRT